MDYKESKFEFKKFSAHNEPYYEGLPKILSLGYSEENLIHHFPGFTLFIYRINWN